jgi:Homeodomain
MDYIHDPYHTTSPSHPALYPPIQFPHFAPPHQSPYDGYYNQYPSADYADFGPQQDEYEEATENLTRPRLTKEQVDVLETQFQAHPKPNSMVKRQLAVQTKLTMPRVANWFQNRRAKAKQQKKQEEFESKQGLSSLQQQEGWKSETNLTHRPANSSQSEASRQETRDRSFTDPIAAPPQLSVTTSPPQSSDPELQEKSWAFLQRALRQAQEARELQEQTSMMPPPAIPRQMKTDMLPPSAHQEQIPSAGPVSAFSPWSSEASTTPWSAPQPSIEHAQFDFNFDPLEESTTSGSEHTPTGSDETMTTQSYAVTPNWTESLHHPVPMQQPIQLAQLNEPNVHGMTYPSSRRGSTSDELTTDFNSFALAGTISPPVNNLPLPPQRSDSNESVDLATRRNRPRPAALGSAAIRSRSYGALSSMSPTLRQNSQVPGPHTVRHVKSTGHSLNARYPGIRKSSSAQRSPLNTGGFADAEAFRRLMAQQTLLERSNEGTGNNTPLTSPDMLMNKRMAQDQQPFHTQEIPTSAQYPPSASTYYAAFTSPPVTPFQADYYVPGQQQLMPPVSAGPQYARFPDYTPPYSAGPLTSSSWSDAPLTSPDVSNFQLMPHMPSMAYSLTHDMATGQYQQFMTSPEKAEVSPTLSEQKKTEFFIHEFPNQKEEHAHVAKQLAQQNPKNYVFSNATPNDY